MVCGGGSGIWNARLALDDVGHQMAEVGPVRSIPGFCLYFPSFFVKKMSL